MAKFRLEHIDSVIPTKWEVRQFEAAKRQMWREKDLEGVLMNITARRRLQRWNEYKARLEAVFEALQRGHSYSQIGAHMGISKQYVQVMASKIPKVLKKKLPHK